MGCGWRATWWEEEPRVTRYLMRRLLWAAVTIFVTCSLIFAATAVLPGDAAQIALGNTATPEALAALREKMGLDQPLVVQYFTWLSGLVRGDLGASLTSDQTVWEILAPRFLASVVLLVLAVCISFPVAFGLGVWAAARKSSMLDSGLTLFILVAVALPEFVIGIAMVYLFAGGVWSVFPAVSTVFGDESVLSNPAVLGIPVLAASFAIIPYMLRMVRAVTIEVLDSEYIETARLSGISATRLLFRHALPNAFAPVAQVCALILVYLLGGLVVIESVVAYPGIGSTLVAAVEARDFRIVQGIAIVLVTLSVLFYVLADIVGLLVSPRVRTSL